jgi:hypothetical protein
MRKIIEWRGTDSTLTEKEKMIYDAIIREGCMQDGSEKLTEFFHAGE